MEYVAPYLGRMNDNRKAMIFPTENGPGLVDSGQYMSYISYLLLLRELCYSWFGSGHCHCWTKTQGEKKESGFSVG